MIISKLSAFTLNICGSINCPSHSLSSSLLKHNTRTILGSTDIVNVYNRIYYTHSHNRRYYQGFRLFSNGDSTVSKTNITTSEIKNPSSNINIELFAAGPKRQLKTPSSTPESILTPPIAQIVNTTATTALPSSNRGSVLELQAEKLRLEAEKEQIQFDEIRIEKEMVMNIKLAIYI